MTTLQTCKRCGRKGSDVVLAECWQCFATKQGKQYEAEIARLKAQLERAKEMARDFAREGRFDMEAVDEALASLDDAKPGEHVTHARDCVSYWSEQGCDCGAEKPAKEREE